MLVDTAKGVKGKRREGVKAMVDLEVVLCYSGRGLWVDAKSEQMEEGSCFLKDVGDIEREWKNVVSSHSARTVLFFL